ncbi:uncharacterized protein BXZ73DRAFT_104549 [Epithele typhae]|uniref:uncharacterized protein n=1 Tax=Epithele typhae TaxID=378194 RepID=UPI002008BB81|nr:uncharacterized protein BXZ73DRAFT_104549 [Epithele typhae]KAH9921259.1 hypothetical protein BXZ73DRAFT_104549 [Epithele typhae]
MTSRSNAPVRLEHTLRVGGGGLAGATLRACVAEAASGIRFLSLTLSRTPEDGFAQRWEDCAAGNSLSHLLTSQTHPTTLVLKIEKEHWERDDEWRVLTGLPNALAPLPVEHLALWVPTWYNNRRKHGGDDDDEPVGPTHSPRILGAICLPLASALPRLQYLSLSDAYGRSEECPKDPVYDYFSEHHATKEPLHWCWFRVVNKDGTRALEHIWSDHGEAAVENMLRAVRE